VVAIVVTYFDPSSPAQVQKALQAWNKLKVNLMDIGACPYRIGTLWADQMYRFEAYHDLLKKLKEALDPNRIMAPGFLGL
jgi:FAD/FMN-containing dehydrogenase